MKSFLILAVANLVLFYCFWGNWSILFIISAAFYYAYKRFIIDYADKLLK
jgi:hypothetical protein